MGIGSGLAKVSIFVVLVAVVIGTVKPTLFLMVPNVGFILWALSGQRMPPYFDPEVFVHDEWLKPGDVVVSIGAKCGTNYMMTIIHELRTWDKPELREFEQITDVVPWAEFSYFPEHKASDHVEYWTKVGGAPGWNNTAYPFRSVKSHFFPKDPACKDPHCVLDIKKNKDVKYIAMTRNPKDVLYSLFPFFEMHSDEFKKMWGGFPPSYDTFAEHFKFVVPDEPVPIARYLRAWWPYRNEPNVLLLHYSDVTADTPRYLRKIADYLGIKITDEGIKNVAERVSIGFMKKRNNKYLYRCGRNGEFRAIKDVEGSIIRKGGSGDFKSVLSKEDEKKFEDHIRSTLGNDPEAIDFIWNGRDKQTKK